MNPPSLREICAKAMPDIPFIPKTEEHMARAFAADHARHILATRFRPETALAVYEALSKTDATLKGNMDYEHAVTGDSDPSSPDCDTPAKLVRLALRLLDGRTEP